MTKNHLALAFLLISSPAISEVSDPMSVFSDQAREYGFSLVKPAVAGQPYEISGYSVTISSPAVDIGEGGSIHFTDVTIREDGNTNVARSQSMTFSNAGALMLFSQSPFCRPDGSDMLASRIAFSSLSLSADSSDAALLTESLSVKDFSVDILSHESRSCSKLSSVDFSKLVARSPDGSNIFLDYGNYEMTDLPEKVSGKLHLHGYLYVFQDNEATVSVGDINISISLDSPDTFPSDIPHDIPSAVKAASSIDASLDLLMENISVNSLNPEGLGHSAGYFLMRSKSEDGLISAQIETDMSGILRLDQSLSIQVTEESSAKMLPSAIAERSNVALAGHLFFVSGHLDFEDKGFVSFMERNGLSRGMVVEILKGKMATTPLPAVVSDAVSLFVADALNGSAKVTAHPQAPVGFLQIGMVTGMAPASLVGLLGVTRE